MPLAPVVGGGSLNPVEFRQKITTNVEHVISRINGIAPQFISEEVYFSLSLSVSSHFTLLNLILLFHV